MFLYNSLIIISCQKIIFVKKKKTHIEKISFCFCIKKTYLCLGISSGPERKTFPTFINISSNFVLKATPTQKKKLHNYFLGNLKGCNLRRLSLILDYLDLKFEAYV